MAFITEHNSRRILRSLDLNKIDITQVIYKQKIYFLNRRECASLLAYKDLMMHPEETIHEMYVKVELKDNERFVFNEQHAPCYHNNQDCEKLRSEYTNWLIPDAIIAKGPIAVERFRSWFKQNIHLLDADPDVFQMRIFMAFGVRVRLEEIKFANSGVVEKTNWDLDTLEDAIDARLREAGRYYYASDKNTVILRQYSRATFLAHSSAPLADNNTGFSDADVKAFLLDYENQFKHPIINMLYDYYRLKFNPELEMEGNLLDMLGFKPCSSCSSNGMRVKSFVWRSISA